MTEQVELHHYPGAEDAAAYELLNRCADPDGRIEQTMWALAPLAARVLLDIGAGSGFHAARYAADATHVYALEPDGRLLRQLHARLSRGDYANVSVLAAGAGAIPLPDRHVDLVHARFAYFFGTDACLPGLREVERVLRPGGHAFIIDANPDRGEMGALARQAYPDAFPPDYTPRNRAFYAQHGYEAIDVDTAFSAPDRDTLAQVFRMDFPHCYQALLSQVEDTTLSYSVVVYHRHLPDSTSNFGPRTSDF